MCVSSYTSGAGEGAWGHRPANKARDSKKKLRLWYSLQNECIIRTKLRLM